MEEEQAWTPKRHSNIAQMRGIYTDAAEKQ